MIVAHNGTDVNIDFQGTFSFYLRKRNKISLVLRHNHQIMVLKANLVLGLAKTIESFTDVFDFFKTDFRVLGRIIGGVNVKQKTPANTNCTVKVKNTRPSEL